MRTVDRCKFVCKRVTATSQRHRDFASLSSRIGPRHVRPLIGGRPLAVGPAQQHAIGFLTESGHTARPSSRTLCTTAGRALIELSRTYMSSADRSLLSGSTA